MDRLGLQVACEADEQTDDDVTPWVVVNVVEKHNAAVSSTPYIENSQNAANRMSSIATTLLLMRHSVRISPVSILITA